MAETALVSFLIAGVQKGGTTALFEHLREHPDLQLPAVKEAHHFDDEGLDWSAPDHAAYHALFTPDARLRGEATPIYTYWPNALERIHAYNPAMRLIVLFRDPVERAWSHWRMEWAKGKDRAHFAWAIREGRSRVDDPAPPGHHRIFSYVERGLYGAQAARMLALFPRDQLLFLASAALRDDPDGTVRAVCRFLGVAPPAAPVRPRIVHEGARIAYPSALTSADIELLRGIYTADQESFAQLTGLALFF